MAMGRSGHWSNVSYNLASGEAGEGARRGRQPKTRMAVFSSPSRTSPVPDEPVSDPPPPRLHAC